MSTVFFPITFSDLSLVREMAIGNESAFAELYRRFSVPVYNYLLRLVRDDAIAEDILQEVFVAVWYGAGRFRGNSQVKTWIYHIAHNKAVSWLRTRREQFELDPEAVRSEQRDLETHVMNKWRTKQVQIALDRLSPEHRAVVELAFYYGMSYPEIAEVVGCPVGTVKSRMSYARQYLSGTLLGMGIGDQPD